MEKYLVVCYAARSANTVRKCKRLVSLPCVATCCMAQKGPLYVTESSAQPEKPRYGRQGQYKWKWNAAKWIWSAAAACRFAWRNWWSHGYRFWGTKLTPVEKRREIHQSPLRLALSRRTWMHWLQQIRSRMPDWFACWRARQSRLKWYRIPVRLTNKVVDLTWPS